MAATRPDDRCGFKPGLPPWGAARPLPPAADMSAGESVGQAAQFCFRTLLGRKRLPFGAFELRAQNGRISHANLNSCNCRRFRKRDRPAGAGSTADTAETADAGGGGQGRQDPPVRRVRLCRRAGKVGRFSPCSRTGRRQPVDDGLDQWNEQHFAVWNGREISLSMDAKSGYRFPFSINAKRNLEDLPSGLIRIGVGPVGDCGSCI